MITNSLVDLFQQHKVVIPPIQRDYAQGRTSGKIPHIRERFLDAIINVLIDDKLPTLELDFVFGYVECDRSDKKEETRFKPLDGQQRLTTLFLIHWFVANKENISPERKSFLKHFSYATRESSRKFCEELVNFRPSFNFESIDKEIFCQSWFFTAWTSDPTIDSILVVLNAIEKKFNDHFINWDTSNIWGKLTMDNPRIIFHLLPMEDLGLPDDLYIKMNARGKGLTDFEHFKSQFSEVISGNSAKIFHEKIDKEWSDLFWNIFKENCNEDIAKDVDNGFLSFFWYITDVLINKNRLELKSTFWLDKIVEVYKNSEENVKFLIDALDLFESLEKEKSTYFEEILYMDDEDFDVEKTKIFFNNPKVNLFRKCAETYGFEEKKNAFSVGEQLLLYAFIYMKMNRGNIDKSKFRCLRNIFSSSDDQLRNDYLSKFLYSDVELIISNQKYSAESRLSKRQLEEESAKERFIAVNPEFKACIFKLEDHYLLRGNIAILPLNESIPQYAKQFQETFKHDCDYFEISKAMLTIGDYSQQYGNLRRLGNKNHSTWREIFTQSEFRKGFENTQYVLKKYLDILISEDLTSSAEIVRNYLEKFEFDPEISKDWRYYYIKYPSFTLWNVDQTEGFYSWEDVSIKPYECTMLFRKQFNGRHWSPFLLEVSKSNKNVQLDNFGNDLQITFDEVILLVKNVNDGFYVHAKDDLSKDFIMYLISNGHLNTSSILSVSKNHEGIDTEDRIDKMLSFIPQICNNLITAYHDR